MTDDEWRNIVLAVVEAVDHDIAKELDPKTALENSPEEIDEWMSELVMAAKTANAGMDDE